MEKKSVEENAVELNQLYELAESNDIQVDSIQLQHAEALSLILEDYSCYIAINPKLLKGTADEKVKLAHELGHCMTGTFYRPHHPADLYRKYESTANRWAIKKLVPLASLKAAIAAGHTSAWELAEHFEVPEWFMLEAIKYWENEIRSCAPGENELMD